MNGGRIVAGGFSALFGAAVIGILVFFGVPLVFAIAWVVIAVAFIVISRQTLLETDRHWPPAPPTAPYRGSEVARLAWGINSRTGVLSVAFVRRLDTTLRTRLALRGLDPDDPAQHAHIDALLGPGIRTVLEQRTLHREDAERILAALDSIPPEGEHR